MRQYFMLLTLSIAATSCSQQSVPSPISNRMVPQVRGGSYSVIYSFKGAPDGEAPHGALWHSSTFPDYLYGTTARGGTGNGTVFRVESSSVAETVLYSFGNKPDAADPEAGVIRTEALYGTSYAGGTNDAGTVYAIQQYGTQPVETVLHSFTGADGEKPNAPLTRFRNTLVGTTSSGGSAMKGVVFETYSGSSYEVVDHSFTGKPDGDRPEAGLMELDFQVYGTTEAGGANDMGCVFEVLPYGKKTEEHVVHSFNGTDGAAPRAGLTVLNGLLYGTTQSGGANNDGTVFEVHKDGTERVVYSFSGSDGKDPVAGLTVLNGLLYGTTYRGGSHDAGTIFEVHTDGTFRMLHDFTGAPDGYGPNTDLLEQNGALYGTTDQGGANNKGSVFKVVP